MNDTTTTAPAITDAAIDDMARRIVAEDVCYCVSGLIGTLLKGATDSDGVALLDDNEADALAYRAPDADDYRDAVPHGERVTIMKRDNDGAPGAGLWEWFGPNSDTVFTDDGADYPETELEAWRSAFDANDWEHPNGSEIYEHWLVTGWLAAKLRDAGEAIADDVLGMTVWGRPTTGQMIQMDAVIQRIARAALEA